VNSCVSCTKIASVVVGLLIVFLETSSLEFLVEIFLVTCAKVLYMILIILVIS
jgi:hypothetical protein